MGGPSVTAVSRLKKDYAKLMKVYFFMKFKLLN